MSEDIVDAEVLDEGITVSAGAGEVVEAIEHGMSKLYLSGPMDNVEDFNHPLFHRVALEFRNANFAVCNPAEFFDGDTTRERKEYMREAFKYVLEADTIVLLPGWEESKGARLEVAMATELDLSIMEYIEADDTTERDDFAGALITQQQYTGSFTPVEVDEDGNEIIPVEGTFTPIEETPKE
jgi:hypothetical protein